MQYSPIAKYYDKLYSVKDYETEVNILLELIKSYQKHNFKTLLDVACGTGGHLNWLKKHYACEGLDINPDLVSIARAKHPELIIHQGDMLNFELGKSYDLITCFFGSIGHVKTYACLQQSVRNFKQHLNSSGLLIIEPWHTPEQFKAGRTDLQTVSEPDLKIARCCSSQKKKNMSILEMHHLICTPTGTDYLVDKLELGLFTEEEYVTAISEGGFTVVHERIRPNGNGVYLAFRR